ncbi:MAG: HAD family phosphatase, partial [bacterium]|nr:HAD family phosphatase [bacterium]
FQKVLDEEGVRLTEKEYYEKYLGLDDKGVFTEILKANGRPISGSFLQNLIRRKNRGIKQEAQKGSLLLPGVEGFVKKAAAQGPVGIVSGALRDEIVLMLGKTGLKEYFQVIVSAEDVKNGKPNPEGFLLGLKKTVAHFRKKIRAAETLVIEDSPWGIEAARRAGMKCLAVTNSYKKKDLEKADWRITSLENY